MVALHETPEQFCEFANNVFKSCGIDTDDRQSARRCYFEVRRKTVYVVDSGAAVNISRWKSMDEGKVRKLAEKWKSAMG